MQNLLQHPNSPFPLTPRLVSSLLSSLLSAPARSQRSNFFCTDVVFPVSSFLPTTITELLRPPVLQTENSPYYPHQPSPPRAHHFQPTYAPMSPENSQQPHGLLPSHLNPSRSDSGSPVQNGEKPKRPKSSRHSSWDILGTAGGRDFEEFDVRKNGVKNLEYAEVSERLSILSREVSGRRREEGGRRDGLLDQSSR